MMSSKVLVVSVILVGELISCKKFILPMNLLRALLLRGGCFLSRSCEPSVSWYAVQRMCNETVTRSTSAIFQRFSTGSNDKHIFSRDPVHVFEKMILLDNKITRNNFIKDTTGERGCIRYLERIFCSQFKIRGNIKQKPHCNLDITKRLESSEMCLH